MALLSSDCETGVKKSLTKIHEFVPAQSSAPCSMAARALARRYAARKPWLIGRARRSESSIKVREAAGQGRAPAAIITFQSAAPSPAQAVGGALPTGPVAPGHSLTPTIES
jgi:hypothetical protein